MKFFLFFVLSVLYFVSASSLTYRNVYLSSDTGDLLSRCYRCGSATYENSASVHGKFGDSFAKFKLYTMPNNKVVLQADTGKYVARYKDCWRNADFPDAAFIDSSNPNVSAAQWTLTENSDGTYGFMADNGNYLARCGHCVKKGTQRSFAFVHASDPSSKWAKWNIINV